MIHPQTSPRRASLLYAAIPLALVTAPSLAAVKTWDGGGSNDSWQTGPNWNADTAPLPDDQLVFAGAVRLNAANDFAAGTLFNGISFPAGAGAFNLTGNGVTLTRGISAAAANGTVTGGNITNSATTVQSLGFPIHLATGKATLNSPTGTGGMNLSGAFTRAANNSLVVTRTGGHINTTGSGLANDASGILGGWAVLGNDWASVNASGNIVAYNGYTFIDSGAIASGANLNYRYTDETANLTAASGTVINTISASISAARSLTITGTMKLGPKGAIYRLGTSAANNVFTVTGGTLTADGGGEITLWDATTSAANFAATNNNLRVDSAITDDGANPVSVNIMGYLDIRGVNTHTGGTFVNQGRIQTGNLGALGPGPVTVYPGGSVFFNNAGNWPQNFTVSGVGSTEAGTNNPAGPGALRLGTTSNLTGTITLQGDTRITSSSSTGAGPVISGRITGTGGLDIVSFANNTALLNLSNAGTPNDWAGPFSINAMNATRTMTVKLGAGEQIPDNSDVKITGQTSATLDLNGFNETIGALNGPASTNPNVTNQAGGTTSTLTVGGNNASGDFGGTIQDKLSDPASTLNLVKNGTGKQILRGITNYFGTTTVNGGTLEAVGDFFGQGTISVNPGATFASSGVVSGDVTLAGGAKLQATGANGFATLLEGNLDLAAGSAIDINTTTIPVVPLTVEGTIAPSGAAGSVTVNLNGIAPPVGEHQLISYAPVGSLGGTGISAFVLGSVPPRFEATLENDALNRAIVLDVTSSGDFPVWRGSLSNEWSTATLANPKNWVLNSNAATLTDFLSGDTVLFNDTAATTTPDISLADVTAGNITFNNTTKDYVLTGTKGILGSGTLTKDGEGKVTIATNNAFTGGTLINAGTLQLGNGGSSGSLGSGDVANEGIFEINRSDDFTLANLIAGLEGEFRHSGSGSTTLSAANLFPGPSTLSAGTVRLTNSASLGSTTGEGVTVQAGAAVDLGGSTTAGNINHLQKQFTISGHGPSGAGALVNNGTVTQLNAFQRVALAAEASVGGSNRFDIRATQVSGLNQAKLEIGSHVLRKRGVNQVTCVATDISGTGGSIIAEQGVLSLETTTNTFGTGSLIFEPGTYGQFYQNASVAVPDPSFVGITWPMTLREGVNIGSANGTAATIFSPVILEGNATIVPFNAAAPSPASNFPFVLTGTITENGGSYSLTKLGVNTTTLTGAGSSYTGATLVSAGTLVVNSPGSITVSPVTVASGATLGGTGTLGGTVAGNGIISPGMALVGTLNTGATTFSASGSLAAQIDSGTLVSDKLAVAGVLNLGGAALALTDLGAATLPAETKFVIASHTGVTGAFANAPDGGNLTLGPNTFKVDYDENVSGQLSITLTVVAGSAYDEWATSKGLVSGNNGKMADPDGDGLENIVEFGLDQHPLQPGDGGKLRATVADVDPGAPVVNAYTITVPMRTGTDFAGSAPGDLLSAAVDGVIYRVEGSANLTSFPLDITEITPALSAGMTGPSSGWTYRSFRLPGTPGNPNPKAFLRVDVAEAP